MGLCLNYELRLPANTDATRVDELPALLRCCALEQRLDEVSPLVRHGDHGSRWCSTLGFWSDLIAKPWEDDVPPLTGMAETGRAFFVNPGQGCETASFGFLTRNDPSGTPAEWFWYCNCKTQYASIVSEENLVRCHTGLVAVLDRAIELGVSVVVRDETHYWETRDRSRLVAEVDKMNRIVARFAGAFADAVEGEHDVRASIFEHPEFERLEMKSRTSND
jgi:hypothetical protein